MKSRGRRSFNSILVRLKAEVPNYQRRVGALSFNSILVRLKEMEDAWACVTAVEFQFHTGSIKRVAVLSQLPRLTSFNSILVRLKVSYGISTTAVVLSVSIPYWFD